jgi:adenosylhomocysteine nucleosidase
MIAVFAALQAEVSACLASLSVQRETAAAGFPVHQAEGAIVCQTGMGPRAKAAAEAVLSEYKQVAAVLSVGIAGGLHPDLKAGDVVVCEHVDHESRRGSGREDTVASHPGLVEAAEAAARGLALNVVAGSSITVDEVAWGEAEKAAHHAWKAHDIVEMESYWAGEAAAARRLPFLAVRTISDGPGDAITNTGAVREDGTFDQETMLAYLRENPEAGATLTAQAKRSRLALGNLAIVMAGLLPPLIQHFRRDVC